MGLAHSVRHLTAYRWPDALRANTTGKEVAAAPCDGPASEAAQRHLPNVLCWARQLEIPTRSLWGRTRTHLPTGGTEDKFIKRRSGGP